MIITRFSLPYKRKRIIDKIDDFLKTTKAMLKYFIIYNIVFYPTVGIVGIFLGTSSNVLVVFFEVIITIGATITLYLGIVLARRWIQFVRQKRCYP